MFDFYQAARTNKLSSKNNKATDGGQLFYVGLNSNLFRTASEYKICHRQWFRSESVGAAFAWVLGIEKGRHGG